jgi:hypothetical protein
MKICKQKNCIHSGVEQPLTNFYKSKKYKDGLTSYCKSCFAVMQGRDPKRVGIKGRPVKNVEPKVDKWNRLTAEAFRECA